jgi:hypothetical protein
MIGHSLITSGLVWIFAAFDELGRPSIVLCKDHLPKKHRSFVCCSDGEHGGLTGYQSPNNCRPAVYSIPFRLFFYAILFSHSFILFRSISTPFYV